ncbi:aminotransferase class IV [Acidocella sp.]|uniref:aminotransferase class IV n=1 Tax=Acidocella sp. TaxID=50710 RepID=UPI0026268225|nr:aminotransferase class IV [Acidocella sp.]
MSEPLLWLNGALLPAHTARIDPADRGFTLGDGLFETMAAQNGTVPELARHFARLTAGAVLLRLHVPLTLDALEAACRDLLAANATPNAALRLTLTRGPAPRGLLPPAQANNTLLITTAPLPPGGKLRLITARIRRDETSPLSAVKTLNYLPGILARIEAAEQGADDALLLNRQGFVAETSGANIFVRLGGLWFTPPVEDGALPGIRRAKLLEASRVREAPLAPIQLRHAEAILVGNALTLRPVIALDWHPIPEGDPAALS